MTEFSGIVFCHCWSTVVSLSQASILQSAPVPPAAHQHDTSLPLLPSIVMLFFNLHSSLLQIDHDNQTETSSEGKVVLRNSEMSHTVQTI